MSNSYPFGGQQNQLYGNPTGFQQQQQPSSIYQPQQQTGAQSFTAYQQPVGYQSTGFPSQSQPFGSSEQSNGNFGTQQPSNPSSTQGNSTTGAPSYATSIDQLSFLTPQDQKKFQDLFNSSTNSVSISPENARGILMKSNLNPHQLARIWDLSDLNKSGDLLFPEFALALHLCNVALRGSELPYVLDSRIKEEVTNLVDKINFSIPEDVASNTENANRPVPQPNISASNIFETAQPQQQQQHQAPNLNSQPTGFGFGNSYPGQQNAFQSQPTGFQDTQHTGFQQSGFQQQQPDAFSQSNNFQSTPSTNPNSYPPQDSNGFSSDSFQPFQQHQALQQQRTGFEATQQQSTGLRPQTTGFAFTGQQSQTSNSLQPQSTGFAPLQSQQSNALHQQATGLVPLKTQNTGPGQPLQQQATGLVPLQNQTTGGQPLKQQQTGLVPLKGQNTGGQPLTQQPTGLIPLQSQNTGGQPLKQQPTGLIALPNQQTGATSGAPPLDRQPTGLVPLQQQQTGGHPLTHQPTGLVPLAATATGSVALQTQLTGPAPLHSQRTGFGNFEPLRAQKTGVGQNSLFLKNLLQPLPQQQQQQQLFSNSLNYTTETITPQEKALFNKIFENYDTNKKGLLTADVSAEIFRKSGLNRSELEKVWDLVTRPNQTHLDKESFQMGMWLVYKRLNGFELPDVLPESLKPSSIRILDDVKQKLKINNNTRSIKKSSNSRIDGSRFKNNDDDLIMSSSRNRRRTTRTDSPTLTKPKENLSIDEIKKRIREKKILLDAFDATGSQLEDEQRDYEKEDLEAIARLKQEIQNLPNVNNTNDSERSHLRQKFNALTSKVPTLINDISQIDNEITRLKLELYKLKNPSFILGSGPNGEVTEADRRKAKSKALLAAKMAKLTGKPIDTEVQNLSDEQGKLDQEAIRIQEENKKNQQMIRDVETSIKEISSNVMNSFTEQVDKEAYKKWELGVGVQPEVQELVKSFKLNDISNRFTQSLNLDEAPAQTHVPASASVHSPAASAPQSTPLPSTSNTFKTPEDRKAYIREQAKKKMNERLAKFGINRGSSPKTSSLASPSSPKPRLLPQVSSQVPEAPVAVPEAPIVVQEQPLKPEPPAGDDSSSSDDDDEEEFERMEEIRRLKRLERDQRLAQLHKEESQNNSQPQPTGPPHDSTANNESPRKYHDSNPFAFK